MSEKQNSEYITCLGQDKCQGQWRVKHDDRDLKRRAGSTGAWHETLKDRGTVLWSTEDSDYTKNRQRKASGLPLPENRSYTWRSFKVGASLCD